MIIINKEADYSNTGLGKIPYVSHEVEALLSIYTGLPTSKKLAFQAFINEIGGLDGDIWLNKIKYLFLPFFSADIYQALKDLKQNSSPFQYMPDSLKPVHYELNEGKLTQLDIAGGIDNRLNITTLWYRASLFGAIERDGILKDNTIQLGYGAYVQEAGNLLIRASKPDNAGHNQQAGVLLSADRTVDSFAVSGLPGNSAENQNLLAVDGSSVLLPYNNLAVVDSGSTHIGRLGFGITSTYPGVRLRSAYLLGYGLDFTKEDTLLVNRATFNLINNLV